MKKFEILRKKYPTFLYEKFFIKPKKNNLEVVFNFEIPPDGSIGSSQVIRFSPKIIIKNIPSKNLKKIDKKVLQNFAFHLGLIEISSYWKLTCSPKIEIKTGLLNKEQIKWWEGLFLKGMGQYFFENRINFKKPNFLKITSFGDIKFKRFTKSLKKDRFLVPMGEGKDSIVTLELLKEKKVNLNCFVVNPNKVHFKILKKAGIKNPIIVERMLDPKLIELNRTSKFLNGHVPITALFSFLSVFCAVLFGFNNVVFSNEKSSNEGNLRYLGETINHQYSKSFEFEKKFRDYLKKYLASNINYFSFLMPLYEIQIAEIFSNFPQYFPIFLSCNKGKKSGFKWCGNCPKCLATFIFLYPFLDKKQLTRIFGKNLFQEKKLLPLLLQLIGEKGFKPFECVGTKKETLIALYLSLQKEKRAGENSYLIKHFGKDILSKYPTLEKDSKRILKS